MTFLSSITFGKDIAQVNKDLMHDDVFREAKLLLERWTQPCGACNKIDYHIVGTTIGEDVQAHVMCGYCGGGFIMLPFALRHIEKERIIDHDNLAEKEDGFGKALKLARMRQGLNQKELAIKLGCDASFVSRLESSERLPSVDTLKHLAKVLGISIDQLVSYLDVEESKPNET